MKFDIKVRDRQSGKTAKLVKKANKAQEKHQEVLYITINGKSVKTIEEMVHYDVEVLSSTFISIDSYENFNKYDVIILDECLFYTKAKLELLISLINKTEKIKVFAMSSIRGM